MKTGFVLGKFMPLHKGHLALIDFASKHCDKLYVILCYTDNEPIPGTIREQWLSEEIKKYPAAVPVFFHYDDAELPNTSESSRSVSAKWSEALKKIVPDADVLFTSEPYGDYVAEFMGISHISFDEKRLVHSIPATQIRQAPLRYWDHIADAAKPYFVQKIVLVGRNQQVNQPLLKNWLAITKLHLFPKWQGILLKKQKNVPMMIF
jgi:HTH-type transcriptional repressor of NAD biosynthesis genes